jgi:nitric oxide reductase activation protein
VSVSTQNELGNGRSVLDIERDALIIMIQALESIGDKYAIYAFSGETRADVEYFVVKDFDEKLSEDVECRIGALEPVYNTRLGPAIRHSITKLKQVEAATKVMVLLSDGEPYDVGVGEVKYEGHFAAEDTRMAIQEGKALGMHFFGITIDKEARDYIDAIFSDVGYTIIDNAVTLPERLPMLYKRITT